LLVSRVLDGTNTTVFNTFSAFSQINEYRRK